MTALNDYIIYIQYFYLQGVVPVIVSSFHDALHPLGGVKVFYTIILYVDCPLYYCMLHRHYAHCCPSWITSNIVMILLMKVSGQYNIWWPCSYHWFYYSSKLISLILNMTKNSESYLNQLVDVKAFQLIGYLLEKVNVAYILL